MTLVLNIYKNYFHLQILHNDQIMKGSGSQDQNDGERFALNQSPTSSKKSCACWRICLAGQLLLYCLIISRHRATINLDLLIDNYTFQICSYVYTYLGPSYNTRIYVYFYAVSIHQNPPFPFPPFSTPLTNFSRFYLFVLKNWTTRCTWLPPLDQNAHG